MTITKRLANLFHPLGNRVPAMDLIRERGYQHGCYLLDELVVIRQKVDDSHLYCPARLFPGRHLKWRQPTLRATCYKAGCLGNDPCEISAGVGCPPGPCRVFP